MLGAEQGCRVPPWHRGDAHRHAAGCLPYAAGSWRAFTLLIQAREAQIPAPGEPAVAVLRLHAPACSTVSPMAAVEQPPCRAELAQGCTDAPRGDFFVTKNDRK